MRSLSTNRTPAHDRRIVSLADKSSFEAEQYRRLRHRIEELAATKGTKVVAVTSAAPHDGKTLTAVNLAVSLSQSRQAKVLLVDADLRRPTVAGWLGIEANEGLRTLLASGGVDLDGWIQRVAGSALDVLPCEQGRHDPYDVLTSPAFAALVETARRHYSAVVIDTPPIVPVPDVNLLERIVDGFILVVAANATPRKLVGEALSLLQPSSVIGLVFNRDPRPFSGYYGGYFQSSHQSRSAASRRPGLQGIDLETRSLLW